MRLVFLQGKAKKGLIWAHTLPESANVVSAGDRLLVVYPGGDPYWIDSEGDCEMVAKVKAKVPHEDNGN